MPISIVALDFVDSFRECCLPKSGAGKGKGSSSALDLFESHEVRAGLLAEAAVGKME
jgi:hypothetical protein